MELLFAPLFLLLLATFIADGPHGPKVEQEINVTEIETHNDLEWEEWRKAA